MESIKLNTVNWAINLILICEQLTKMATHPYTWRGIWNAAITGFCIIAVASGLQAAFAPTVRVSCPTRTSASPDCELRWLVAFDTIPIRRTPLPALQSAGEIEATSTTRSSS